MQMYVHLRHFWIQTKKFISELPHKSEIIQALFAIIEFSSIRLCILDEREGEALYTMHHVACVEVNNIHAYCCMQRLKMI